MRRESRNRPTLQDLGRRIGCSHVIISRFENGEAILSDRLLRKYAQLIGASLAEVLDAFTVARATYYNTKAAEANRELEERLKVRPLAPKRAAATP